MLLPPSFSSVLSLFLFLLSLPLSTTLRCFDPDPPTLLPARRDCRAIIAGINWVSTRPSENYPRSWGRHLPPTSTTENLPRVFIIEGRQPPNLCAVEVDVDPLDILEVNIFTLTDLTAAARRIFTSCLMGRAKIGLDNPMAGGKVWAKLFRIEYVPPWVQQKATWSHVNMLGTLTGGGRLVVLGAPSERGSGNGSIEENR